jgi:hypothetical protein
MKQQRAEASTFAREVMREQPVAAEDAPYIHEIITEAALFEQPLSNLEVAVTQSGDFYSVSIKGYQDLIDLATWVNTFLGKNRQEQLSHVTQSFVQLSSSGGAVMVIQMERVKFKQAAEPEDGWRGRRFARRIE